MTRTLTALLLCTLTLTAVTGCKKVQEELAASQNPFPKSSPLHAPVDRVTRKLINDPVYVQRMQGVSREQAMVLGAQFTMSGMARLDVRQLEHRAELFSQILEKQPVADCAAMVKVSTAAEAARNADRLFDTLATMPQPVIDQWFDFTHEAAMAELHQRPRLQISDAQVNEAAMALVNLIPSERDQRRLGLVLSNISMASDADACWAARTLYAYIPKLPEPQRGHMAWAVTRQ